MSRSGGDNKDRHTDTILKSGFSGVAATFLAVTLSSPAGLGGLVGASVAAGDVSEAGAVEFPDAPDPLSAADLSAIHERLASSMAEMESMREATDARIEQVREIAQNHQVLAYALPDESEFTEAPPVDPNVQLANYLLRGNSDS